MLKVSDPDISCTELTYYKDAILDLPNVWFKPHIALINAINNPKYTHVVACFSRRIGKTYITNLITSRLKKTSKVIIISRPPGDSKFKDMYFRGGDPAYPGWVSIHADYKENPNWRKIKEEIF